MDLRASNIKNLSLTAICFSVLMVTLLMPCMADAASKDKAVLWKVKLNAKKFKADLTAVKEAEVPSGVIGGISAQIDVKQAAMYSVKKLKKAVLFEITGKATEKRTMRWNLDIGSKDLSKFNYYSFRYKARSVMRDKSNYVIFSVAGKDTVADANLINCSQLIKDDVWHTVIGKIDADFTADSLQLTLSTKDSSCSLAIGSLIFSSQIPRSDQSFVYEIDKQKNKNNFLAVDLTGLFNDTMENAIQRVLDQKTVIVEHNVRKTLDWQHIITDVATDFRADKIIVDGIPFKVKQQGNNIIHPADSSYINKEKVEFLGKMVERNFFFPVSRDDAIEIDVDAKASEVFFIITAELPSATRRFGVEATPFFFDDFQMFQVELQYEDGTSDQLFPYSMTDKGYILRRATAAYVVPADSTRQIKKILVHNKKYVADLNVVAVTFNTSANRVYASLLEEPELIKVPELAEPAKRDVYMTLEDNIVKCGNSYYDLTVNCQDGFSLEKFVNRFSPETEITLDKASSFEVVQGNRLMSGLDFNTDSVELSDNTVIIKLSSKDKSIPLSMDVAISCDESAEIKMNFAITNTGKEIINSVINIPVIKGVTIGGLEDTWLFFPKYRNLITNQVCANLSGNDHTFPMQFFDIYNPKVGVGLAVVTHNLDHAPLNYGINKDDMGVTGFVQYPKDYYVVEPNETIQLTETSLVTHTGDWHQGMAAYKNWLDTWYKPQRAKNRKWYEESFLLRKEVTAQYNADFITYTPPMFDAKNGFFKVDEVLEADRQYCGMLPDILHFYGWTYSDKLHDEGWGEYYYENVGGLDTFRNAIRSIQENYNTPVSLYVLMDRCSTISQVGKRIGEKIVRIREDGSKMANSKTWFVCPSTKEWQDFITDTIIRVRKETSANLMYLDVLGFWKSNVCYSKEHGHRVPSWYNEATNKVVTKVRKDTPPETVFWAEYPLNDLNSQYIDGNIHYYYMYLYELWARTYNTVEDAPLDSVPSINVYRYIFPQIKQFDFPCRMQRSEMNEINQLKFTFFNGEALYDCSWHEYRSWTRNMMNKFLMLKKKFADCFSTTQPVPLIQTQRAKVYANKFPSKERTVWTIYNGRYTTVTGPVLAIEHVDGAIYYDAWNNKTLLPEIVDGKAIIDQKLTAQAIGCVVQTLPKN